jgi:hypothetical protein
MLYIWKLILQLCAIWNKFVYYLLNLLEKKSKKKKI